MIFALIELLLGIACILYLIYAFITKNNRMLLSNNYITKILTIIYLVIYGVLFIFNGLILTYEWDKYYYLIINSNILSLSIIYIILYIILEIIFTKVNKEKIIKRNVLVAIIILLLLSLLTVKELYRPNVIIDEKNNKITICDFIYRKNIKYEDIDLIQIEDTIPKTDFDLFGITTLNSYKGLYHTEENSWTVILNRLDSESTIRLLSNNKLYVVGYKSKDELQMFYNVLSNSIKDYYKEDYEKYNSMVKEQAKAENILNVFSNQDGHGSTIEESIEDFLSKHPDVSREDLNFDLEELE